MIALILILFSGAAIDALPKDIHQKVSELNNAHNNPEFKQVAESLTLRDRAAITSFLKDQVKDPSNNPPVEEVRILVNLGDDETIAKEVQSFPDASHGGRSSLDSSIQPKVITALAPNMFVNEPYSFEINIDVGVIPMSFETTEAIREVLVRSPYFPKEVNQWAAGWQYKDPTLFRETMRNWWNENKPAFYSGNYAAVKPGAPAPAPPTLPPTAEILLTPTPTPLPTETPTPIPVTTATASQSSPSNPFILPVAIGLAALLIGIVVFLFRSRK